MRVWATGLALLVAVLLAASPALAQATGGSFGGGSFGRSSSGSSAGPTESRRPPSTWSGGSSRGSGPGTAPGLPSAEPRWPSAEPGWPSTGSRRLDHSPRSGFESSDEPPSSTERAKASDGGGLGWFGTCCCCFGAVALLLVASAYALSRQRGWVRALEQLFDLRSRHYAGPDAMYVSQLSLGIDWRARRQIQDALTRLAETGDTATPQGLAKLLRETVLALRRAELSWLYAAHEEPEGPLSPQVAEQRFRSLAANARAAFKHELVRNADGHVTSAAAPALQAKASEGEGVVVVHVLVAAYRPLVTVQSNDGRAIRRALDNRAALTADELGALEVIWSPAAEDDRMSTAELEQLYPNLRLIDPNSIAGRTFCSYCRGPFAMELLECPHCGAPAEASRDNRPST